MASFNDLAEVAQSISQTQSRLQIVQAVGNFLARLDPAQAEIAARFLIGRPFAQGDESRLNVSGRAIWKITSEMVAAQDRGEDLFAAAVDFGEVVETLMRLRGVEPEPTLTISGVGAALSKIASIEGRASRQRKLNGLHDLFERASNLEAKYLAKILIGEMRHGMSEGLMLEAVAAMAQRPIGEVRRSFMLEGDLGRLVAILRGVAPAGAGSVGSIKPLRPMLAQPAAEVADAFAIFGAGNFALEHKVDGARVQIHRVGNQVRIFSRRMNEITPSLPEVVEWMERLGEHYPIFDGEIIAVDGSGRPLAFQELMRRFRRIREIARLRSEQPVRLLLFDLIGLDGDLLIDRPYRERIERLGEVARAGDLETVDRLLPTSLADAEQFFKSAVASGYEGVMAKSLDSLYQPGGRGRGWLKIKHVRTLDLVIVAADWGYGRRHEWLSNYHLAARGDRPGELLEVGKTFKGLTDEQFAEMTRRLEGLKTSEALGTVRVKPEVVVEVAYNDIQRSPQYEGRMALRFARILRIRDDKSAEEADTIETMRREFESQPIRPRSPR
ncbi:MAG TPA: ATP-dependent DNA ligase [Candidatus Binataceae bacterium]